MHHHNKYTLFRPKKEERIIRKDVWGLLGNQGIQKKEDDQGEKEKEGEDFSMIFIEEEIKLVYEFSLSLFFIISLGNLCDS
jgi:hypothetical protein